MNVVTAIQQWPLAAIAAIVAGVVVLVLPRALNYAVAAYLLFVGALGLLHAFYGHAVSAQAVVALVAGALVLIKPEVLNFIVGIYLILIGLLEAGILRA